MRIACSVFTLAHFAACSVASAPIRAQSRGDSAPTFVDHGSHATRAPRVAEFIAGDLDQCARMTDGTVRCWGRNGDGRLGDGTDIDRDEPTPVVDASDVVHLAIGSSAGWGVRRDGSVLFWGNDNLAWAIDPEMRLRHSHRATPVRGLADIVFVAAGDESACAITRGGGLACLGYNQFGQLGAGVLTPIQGASVVVGLPPIRDVAVGLSHACAVDDRGAIWCWGANDHGQLGSPPSPPIASPTRVTGVPRAMRIAAGRNESCAIDERGGLWCWGENRDGEIGIGRVSEWEPPSRVDVAPAMAIAVGAHHACALTTNRSAWCWGDNGFAQLALNVLGGPHPSPLRVDYASGVVAISAAGDDTCVTTEQDDILCVGAPSVGVRRYSATLAHR